jgi:hypothetical protein
VSRRGTVRVDLIREDVPTTVAHHAHEEAERRGPSARPSTPRARSAQPLPAPESFVVVVETPRLASADIKTIAQRFAARLLAEAEEEGILSGVPKMEVPPRGCSRRGRDRGKQVPR